MNKTAESLWLHRCVSEVQGKCVRKILQAGPTSQARQEPSVPTHLPPASPAPVSTFPPAVTTSHTSPSFLYLFYHIGGGFNGRKGPGMGLFEDKETSHLL